ncbi:MAG: FAD-binding protein [Spirochaetes bacterium]|nr:FAD-binding protein [Spirochaetota bacterium]
MKKTPQKRASTARPKASPPPPPRYVPAPVRPRAATAWHGEYDFIIVGFGAAGASAAIEAHDRGAKVLVLERFSGGGASKMSGGVLYAGGGTRQQLAAGFKDSPEKMLRYLTREMETNPLPGKKPSIDRKALKHFCDRSKANLEWLEGLGLDIPLKFFAGKTNQPPGGFGLYFSGNEKQYAPEGEALPRGHVPLGTGMSGSKLFRTLHLAVEARGIPVRRHARAVRLLQGERGAVIGVEIRYSRLFLLRPLTWPLAQLGFVSATARRLLGWIETTLGAKRRLRARRGVLLSTGGHVYDKALFQGHAPAYRGTFPLGTPGDDGSALRLGLEAGGAMASRFIYPPEALVTGILVNRDGRRFVDESVYGASLSRSIAAQENRAAWLIIDSRVHREAARQVRERESFAGVPLKCLLSGEMNALLYRRLTCFVNLHFNRKKARTLESLAAKCGIPPGALRKSMEEYREAFLWRQDKAFGKSRDQLAKLAHPPYYAIDCRIDNLLFPIPCLTLGGLKSHGLTSQVLRENGSAIPGLYAAGRSGAGVLSRSYVSGFSLAECVYSGRNAAAHAAAGTEKR